MTVCVPCASGQDASVTCKVKFSCLARSTCLTEASTCSVMVETKHVDVRSMLTKTNSWLNSTITYLSYDVNHTYKSHL